MRQVPLNFADPRRSHTRSFERYALELSRLMTIQDVAQHLQVGWDVIKDIQKRDLEHRYHKPRLGRLARWSSSATAKAPRPWSRSGSG